MPVRRYQREKKDSRKRYRGGKGRRRCLSQGQGGSDVTMEMEVLRRARGRCTHSYILERAFLASRSSRCIFRPTQDPNAKFRKLSHVVHRRLRWRATPEKRLARVSLGRYPRYRPQCCSPSSLIPYVRSYPVSVQFVSGTGQWVSRGVALDHGPQE